MSRAKCPECGAYTIIYSRLVKYKGGLHPNTGKGAKFNHAKAQRMFAQGLTLSAIAQKFDVHVTSVRDMLERKGVDVKRERPTAKAARGGK